MLNSLADMCICLEATFSTINSRIKNFPREEYPAVMLDHLKAIRLDYTHGVRSTQAAEKYARYYVTFFYLQFGLFNIVNIVDAHGDDKLARLYWIIYLVLDFSLLIYVTVRVVSVNQLSSQGLEDLYELSYFMRNQHLQHENDIFINRMLWKNVGFTFGNLFIINTNFITSMFTLALTLVITLANFLY
ncbi:uncharacterized protein LOC128392393 [Panonychus citri]|uniref:uncharacterized protein LOC128392393 n=1 Tax=Panonychus citri TaxID=50023 RepID=UPI002307A374|nr:uncharacterized protein LOC128392393 [Panonychus citri]